MKPWLVALTLLAALTLGLAALWLAGEAWEEYEQGENDMPAASSTTAGPADGPLPLQEVIRRLRLPDETRILEIERKRRDGRLLYEIELLTPGDRVYELLVDSHTGHILEQEEEDD